MLEGMASGSMLVTEDSNNGLRDLFKPDEELGVFSPDNIICRIEEYLGDKTKRENIARLGRDKVMASHDVSNRVKQLVLAIEKTKVNSRPFEL